MSYMIINGPQHGCPLQNDTEHEDGTILHVPAIPQIRRHPDDADIRFAHPTFNHKYLLMGKYAYYLGEEMIEKRYDL